MKAPYSILFFLSILLGTTQADSEIKLQGRSTISSLWFEIEDDGDSSSNDSPRGGNGTEFGNVKLGETKTRDFRIQNTGNETLNITSATADSSQYSFLDLNLPIAIPANSDHEFRIRYAPAVFATRTLRIVINNDEGSSNSSERRYTFRVDGTGTGPDLTIFGSLTQDDAITDGAGTPPSNNDEGRHFGTVQAGGTNIISRPFTLSNSGNDGLNLSNPRFTGSGAAAFGYTGVNAGVNIGDGNARTFGIRFNPPIAGTYDAIFHVDTNDERAGRGTYSFAVRGVGIGVASLEIKGKDRNTGFFNLVENDEEDPRAGNGTGWANRNIGAVIPFEDHEFRLENDGTDTLTITEITTTNQVIFPVYEDPLSFPIVLEPGETQPYFIQFRPQQPVDYTATITVHSDDFLDQRFTYQVGGAGTGLSAPPMEMTVEGLGGNPLTWSNITHRGEFPVDTTTENATQFPTTIIGQTRVASFRIRNAGVNSLNITAAGSGSDSSEFALAGLTSSNLGINGITEFQIHFTPAGLGDRPATIEIVNNDGEIGGVFRIRVRGTGIEEPAGVGPEALVLGGEQFSEKVLPGNDPDEDNGTVIGFNGTHQSTFRIFNSGDKTLKVAGFEIEDGGGQFNILNLPEDTAVQPGELHEFIVEYTGANQGETEAGIILHTNQEGLEEYFFPVVAVEIDDPAPNYPPRITAIETDDFDILLTVDAPAGRTFQIFLSLDLQNWIPIIGQSNQSAGTKRIPLQISGPPTGLRRFYKVEED